MPKKNRKSGKQKIPPSLRRGGFPRRAFIAGGAILAGLAAAGWFSVWRNGGTAASLALGGDLPRKGETRPVLPPEMFRGAVRRAYQAARELPDLFDKLYCYCYCDRSFGHKSLLSCYATKHGAGLRGLRE
jgi:hypothetical protein